ncbi:hypothetical protein [Kitasatospora sp. NPDC098663]
MTKPLNTGGNQSTPWDAYQMAVPRDRLLPGAVARPGPPPQRVAKTT